MTSLADKAEQLGLEIEVLEKNAAKIAEAFASAGLNGTSSLNIASVYREMIKVQIEIHEG